MTAIDNLFDTGPYLKMANGGTGAGTAAAAAEALGVGITDSPQFAGVNIGHATDTTLTRISAGVAAIEGKNIALNGTGETLTTGSIELGAASDTTITRSAAGVIAVEGGVIPKENRANTYTQDQRIDANLGLGAAPVSKLHVDGASFVNGGSSLPALSATLVTGEIHAGTGNSLASDSGHLRLSAGGGTTLGVKAAIDLYRENGGGTGIIAYTTGTERMRIDASGNVGIGTAPSTKLDVVGSTITAIRASNGTEDARLFVNAGVVGLASVSNTPLYFYTNNAERMRIDTSGNVLVTGSGGLGYGTGSGGTVTQATSKSTGVTLNKTNGQITMNNAALAGGATATFALTNSTIATTDTIIVIPVSGNYSVRAYISSPGVAGISVTNVTGGSLSDALVINFSIIKAVTS